MEAEHAGVLLIALRGSSGTVRPQFVHGLADGWTVEPGGPELADELEEQPGSRPVHAPAAARSS